MELKSYVILSFYGKCKADVIHPNFNKTPTFPPSQKKKNHSTASIEIASIQPQVFSLAESAAFDKKKCAFRKVLINYEDVQNNYVLPLQL